MKPPRARCIAPNCDRTPKGGSSICERCWRYTPAEATLAVHDHADAYRRADDELKPFIEWSWTATMHLAAHEATRRRERRRAGLEVDDPDAAHWVILASGEIALVQRVNPITRRRPPVRPRPPPAELIEFV